MKRNPDDNFAKLLDIDKRLAEEYGRPRWRSHGPPLEVLIGTVLSQHTSDVNTARAFASLRKTFPKWQDVISSPTFEVANAIRSGGLANIKAPRIQNILRAIEDETGILSLDWLRHQTLDRSRMWLEALPGVGPKTASCVLLFSLGFPAMPVDTHVHRVSRRLGLIAPVTSANDAHRTLDRLTSPDRDLIYGFHVNLIAHGRAVCKARSPACSACVLNDICPSGAPSIHRRVNL